LACLPWGSPGPAVRAAASDVADWPVLCGVLFQSMTSQFRALVLACAGTLVWLPAWAQASQEPKTAPAPAPQQTAPTPPQTAPAPPAPAPGQTRPTPPPSPTPAPQPPASAPAEPAQEPARATGGTVVVCGQQVAVPANLPPAGSGPVLWLLAPCFEKQGGSSVIDPQTYLYYLQAPRSRPSEKHWEPWNAEAEQTVLGDFRRLWATNFLDDLSIEVNDHVFPNGVVGKIVIYQMEERQRVKIVDYAGTDELDSTKIDEKLREEGAVIRLDTFLDPGLVRRVEGIIRSLLSEKGFLEAKVSHVIKPVGDGPKLVHLTFNITDGPEIKIKNIDFIGNQAVSDRKLRGQMKNNKQPGFFSFITGGGTFKEELFEEDAVAVQGYYREEGYLKAQVGQPEIRTLRSSTDGKTRDVELRIPITEGRRYKVGQVAFADNKAVRSEALQSLVKIKSGDFYNEKRVRKDFEKIQEVYGAGGYFEFVPYPEFKFQDAVDPEGAPGASNTDPKRPAVVDVVLHMNEGEQYFVNKITFVGNNTTRDHVIRREMRLLENGVFNTEALKYSVKRLNQLGYFKPLEDQKAIQVEKTPNEKNQVDVTLKLEEQNRNQITFGAGVSQYEGVFGQLAFQTANFLGRGETLSLLLAAGSRSANYQLAFTEPFLFDRPITAGFDVYKRQIRYIGAFTQDSIGGNTVVGWPLADFTRAFMSYSHENVRITDLDEAFRNPELIQNNPYLIDALLLSQGGRRTISKVTPSVIFNTVDNPIFPNAGKRLSLSTDIAGLGGNVSFISPRVDAVWFIPHTRRTTIGLHAQTEYITPYGDTVATQGPDLDKVALPIFERLFMGGEYSVRGFDLRSIGPREESVTPPIVIGGNKSLLFNAEYQITVAGPVRLVLFYDAGQVRDFGERFRFDEFKTSTGAEVRFFMPVLNVPFRLIFAYNPQREGVLDNNYEPQKEFTFRFAVGSTF
jgi:outer membrane protein insertion porin family